MRILTTLAVVVAAMLISSSTVAADPRCVGATQANPVDFSDGDGALCVPTMTETGEQIPASKTVTCNVTFRDGEGQVIGSEDFSGAPGSLHPFSVPRDGLGEASAVCAVDGLTSDVAAGTVGAVFPIGARPAPPVLLP